MLNALRIAASSTVFYAVAVCIQRLVSLRRMLYVLCIQIQLAEKRSLSQIRAMKARQGYLCFPNAMGGVYMLYMWHLSPSGLYCYSRGVLFSTWTIGEVRHGGKDDDRLSTFSFLFYVPSLPSASPPFLFSFFLIFFLYFFYSFSALTNWSELLR